MLKVRLNLRKVVAVAACFAVITIFSSCDEDEKQPEITVENATALSQTVYADQTSGASEVRIVTPGAWSSTISAGIVKSVKSGEATWLSINPNSGAVAGQYTISVILEPNLTGDDREATVTITSGDTKIDVEVTQRSTKATGEPYLKVPTLITAEATNVTATAATVGGNITDAGMPTYTERGVVYATTENPIVDSNGVTKIAVAGSGTGSFEANLTDLTSETTYYARAYATNSNGTAYGNAVTFTTDEDLQPNITLTTMPISDMWFSLAGTGTATIDWGDGTDEKFTLSDDGVYWSSCDYSHDYTGISASRTITITGKNITEFSSRSGVLTNLELVDCKVLTFLEIDNNQLTSLDASGCTALIELNLWGNQLKNLNVSNLAALVYLDYGDNQLTSVNMSDNVALEWLRSSYNPLTSFDLSNNPALRELYCNENQLTSLDVSNNTALSELYCYDNLLEAENGLNALFRTLHSNAGIKKISISGNPGTDDCDRSIATSKGWTVYD